MILWASVVISRALPSNSLSRKTKFVYLIAKNDFRYYKASFHSIHILVFRNQAMIFSSMLNKRIKHWVVIRARSKGSCLRIPCCKAFHQAYHVFDISSMHSHLVTVINLFSSSLYLVISAASNRYSSWHPATSVLTLRTSLMAWSTASDPLRESELELEPFHQKVISRIRFKD